MTRFAAARQCANTLAYFFERREANLLQRRNFSSAVRAPIAGADWWG